jgi:hypothetical protein
MIYRTLFTFTLLLPLVAAYIPAGVAYSGKHEKTGKEHSAKKVVYVCACLGDKSCSCMTEAKMEGPCACGAQGGPPLKPVAADSDWAKENRDALAR